MECKDLLQNALADRVYADMQLDKAYVDIEKCYDEPLGTSFVQAKNLSQNTVLVLPLLCNKDLDLIQLGKFQQKFMNNSQNSIFLLAICDTTSNISYYNVGSGFVERSRLLNT